MPFMEWRDHFSVGDDGIDRQHKKIITMMNDLHRAMSEGHGREHTFTTVKALIEYIKDHFTAEEALMKAADYPHLPEHRNRHNRLTRHVLNLYDRLQGSQSPSPHELLAFLQEWLIDHIIKTDKLYTGAIAELKGSPGRVIAG